jgi:hypothetical protein
MAGLLKYLEKKKDSYFNTTELDMLIYANLSYLNYERLNLNYEMFYKISSFKDRIEELIDLNLLPKKNKKLFNILMESAKYKDLEIGYFKMELERVHQFGAMVFRLDDELFVTFRGTDTTINGWKENFNMLVLDEIPSQKLAKDYLNEISKLNKPFTIIGHSKGGNIAIYGAIYMNDEYKHLIKDVYSFDAPGFKDDISHDIKYLNIKEKIHNYIPQDDIVGVLLNHFDDCTIVKSKGHGADQHDMFLWEVEDDKLKRVKSKTRISKSIDKAGYDWLNSLSIEDRKKMLNIIASIFNEAHVTNVLDLKFNSFRTIFKLLNSYSSLSKEEKKYLRKVLFDLSKYYMKYYFGFKKKQINVK